MKPCKGCRLRNRSRKEIYIDKMFGNNHLSVRGLPSCHSERAQRPKNLHVAQGKLPEEESLEILRSAQNDIRLLPVTLGQGGKG